MKELGSKNILVVGDVMLDVYFVGEATRISPEAPVPVFRKRTQREVLGGAANVAANLMDAGQKVSICAVVGLDENGRKIRDLLESSGIDDSMVIGLPRTTTTKTRFLAGGSQQILRSDEEDTSPLLPEESRRLLDLLEPRIGSFDAVIVSDYMKGLLTPDFTQALISLAKARGIEIFVDVKDVQCEKYRGATLVKPNLKELGALTGLPVSDSAQIEEAASVLLRACDCDYVLCTMGAKGMMLVDASGMVACVQATAHDVYDVSGAGDTAIAYLVVSRANGIDMRDAMEIANVASGIKVSKVGTSPVRLEEVSLAMEGASAGKIVKNRIVGADYIRHIRNANVGKTIVFTNGCFDILHVGHVKYLRQAASMGDILIVGVNSDESVRQLKGEGRPINPVEDRAAMLASFDFIDYVIIFEEDTPYEVIKAIQPDVLVKGGDYSIDQIVGRDIVEANGGVVRTIPLVEGKSSTNIINRILELDGKEG